ncbi:MAG: AAA family ATPase [Ruminococcus flavefaciens]|nr:AAA family ATPase [Ruminococcus flavefaciens]
MEHYITEINIGKLRHLSNIIISLNPEQRQHLIITGKNGSGKTSLLVALKKCLQAINKNEFNYLMNDCIPKVQKAEQELNEVKTEEERQKIKRNYDYEHYCRIIKQYADGIKVSFNNSEHLEQMFEQGDFITAYFPANRKTQIVRSQGVEDIKLSSAYEVNAQPGIFLQKYMVHLKTQQAYARNEGDMVTVGRIQKWFDRFVGALQILLDNDSIELEYDYKEYNFKIHESGRNPFSLDELSDGYSSVVQIVSDLILRMDKNWLLGDKISQYNIEGIVLIDEIETHLHIALQKKIMPFLTEFFPRIQFIITTHSPYILNSLANAKVYDLENCVELEDLSAYSADALAEGYFEADAYSDKLKEKLRRYKELKEKQDLTELLEYIS